MRRVYPREELCMGCRLCEVWCTVQHSRSGDPFKAYRLEHPRPSASVRVNESDTGSFALQCRHCPEPQCLYACPSGALHRDERGAVVHDPRKCVGCWSCIMACPFGAIQRDERARHMASKCDLCPGEGLPACVSHCPNQALVLLED